MHLLSKLFYCEIIINSAEKQNLLPWIPLLSPIIVIATFATTALITRNNKKAESKRAWYFKAYFENQVLKVDDLFTQADSLIKEALIEYKSYSDSWPSSEKVVFIGSTLSKLSDLKRRFQIEVVNILQYTYPEIFKNSEDYLIKLEDAATDAFKIDLREETYFPYLEEIYKVKAKLLSALSKPALD